MQVLEEVDITTPRIPVISNVTGAPFPGDAGAIRELLGRQLVEPVQWEATLRAMADGRVGKLMELGPGQQIKAMVRRVNTELWTSFRNVPC